MAIAKVNNATNTNTGNVAWSTSFNCTGADYLLYSCSMGRANSGVTYNGVAMTLIGRVTQSALVAEVLELWGLKAPATGANNLTVTPSAGAPQDTKGTISCWSGVDQTTPIGTAVTTNQDNQSNASVSATVSSATGEVVVATAMVYNKAVTAGSGQTSLGVQQAFPGNAASYKAGAASVSMSYSWSGGQISAIIAVPLKPASAGGSNTLQGASTGTSSVSGSLSIERTLAGASTGTSAASATLTNTVTISGNTVGTSNVSGTLSVARSLTGTSGGTSAVSAALDIARTLSGNTSGTSTVSGSISITRTLQGATTGTSNVSAALDNQAAGVNDLAGSSAGASTVSAALSIGRALQGASAGTSAVSASLSVGRALQGSAAGTSAMSGSLGNVAAVIDLAGGASGTSNVSGSLTVGRTLAGSAAGTSSVSAALDAYAPFYRPDGETYFEFANFGRTALNIVSGGRDVAFVNPRREINITGGVDAAFLPSGIAIDIQE